MKGHKRFRSGAWRLVVNAGTDPVTAKRRNIYETVREPNTREGAKAADARLAELIVAVESGRHFDVHSEVRKGPTVSELAATWQEANRPRQDKKGAWAGWSPKTAKTVGDNFRFYVLPTLGHRRAAAVTGVEIDRLYRSLEDESGLAPSTIARIHGQLRAMFQWAFRKKLVPTNPAHAADPPKVKPRPFEVPPMEAIRAVQEIASADFAAFIQLAATLGARRGTLVALRWGDVDLDGASITFSRSIADSVDGPVEKGTKADRAYTVTLGPSTVGVVRQLRARCEERAKVAGTQLGTKSFVFSDDGGTTPWSLWWPSHAWERYSKKAGLQGVRLHDLRHSAASQMLMAGIPISVVAERLGCTEGNILQTYRHFVRGSDSQAAELMDRLLDPGEEVVA